MQLPSVMIGHSSKAYATLAQSRQWATEVVDALAPMSQRATGVFLCAPAPVVPLVAKTLTEAGALVGAQDVSRFGLGPHTGETAAQVLAETGSQLAMVGHPERARMVGEQLEDVRAKCKAASEVGIVPVLIIGEPRRGDAARPLIDRQLEHAFAEVSPQAPVIVAYEPSWAIGQPEPAPPEYVIEMVAHIRERLAGRTGQTRVLYGGSAAEGTFEALTQAAAQASSEAPDGLFLGRGGLDPHRFLATVTEVRQGSRL